MTVGWLIYAIQKGSWHLYVDTRTNRLKCLWLTYQSINHDL